MIARQNAPKSTHASEPSHFPCIAPKRGPQSCKSRTKLLTLPSCSLAPYPRAYEAAPCQKEKTMPKCVGHHKALLYRPYSKLKCPQQQRK